MKRILVPTDFTENARHALRIAATIATKTGASLEIVHSNTIMAYAAPQPEYYTVGELDLARYYESAAESLYALKRELLLEPEFRDLDLETRIEEGFLSDSLGRVAEEDEADLIVMGTQGSHGLAEFFIGSNTERVIRNALCPVLAVPAGSKEFALKTIVLASTLEPDQKTSFKLLARWQRYFPFEVKVLYINNPADLENDAEIREAAGRMAEASGLENVQTFIIDSSFDEERSIQRFAGKVKADLIVMATHQRHGLGHLLFGSMTEDAANHAALPVLCIPIRK